MRPGPVGVSDERPARAARRRRGGLGPRELRAVGLSMVVAALLTLLTILTFYHLPRYDLAAEPLLDNLDFRDGFRGWDTLGLITLDEGELGRAILQNRKPDHPVYLRRAIELPKGRKSLLVSAEVASERVRSGEEAWQTARIYLVQEAPNGTWLWNQPNQLVHLVGDSRRHRVAKIFEIPGTIDRALLGIELAYATGQFEIANLQVALVDELPLFRLVATLLVAAWCLLVAWVVWRVMGGVRSRKVRGLILATVALLVAGTFMPSTVRQHIIDSFAAGFGLDFIAPDTLGHAAVFALLALLVRGGRRRDPLLLHLSCWVLVGAALEALQLLTADRTPSARDWFADAMGAAIGLALAELGFWLERRLRPPKKPRPERPPPFSQRPL